MAKDRVEPMSDVMIPDEMSEEEAMRFLTSEENAALNLPRSIHEFREWDDIADEINRNKPFCRVVKRHEPHAITWKFERVTNGGIPGEEVQSIIKKSGTDG